MWKRSIINARIKLETNIEDEKTAKIIIYSLMEENLSHSTRLISYFQLSTFNGSSQSFVNSFWWHSKLTFDENWVSSFIIGTTIDELNWFTLVQNKESKIDTSKEILKMKKKHWEDSLPINVWSTWLKSKLHIRRNPWWWYKQDIRFS